MDICFECGQEVWVNSLGYCKACMQKHIEAHHREQASIKVGDDVLVKHPQMKKPRKGTVFGVSDNNSYRVWLPNSGLCTINGAYLKKETA